MSASLQRHPGQRPAPREAFLHHLQHSLEDRTFIRLVLSRPAVTPSEAPLRVAGRLIDLRGAPHLSLTACQAQGAATHNVPLPGAPAAVAAELDRGVTNAWLETTARDWQLQLSPRKPPRLQAHRPRSTASPPRSHDEPQQSWLDATASPWLQALGILGPDGARRASLADKHRQIHRFTEILAHLLQDPTHPPQGPLRVTDMGCGKGYLTFGAWHVLRRLGWQPEVVGIELRPGLVEAANAIVQQLQLPGLRFVNARIDTARLEATDVLIALHACNTATDEAMLRGVELGARWILVAPCCHQELRPQLGHPEPLAPVLQHGLFQERMAEWLTDGLRSLFMEWAGYETRAIEFVSPEHTARNVLLAGVRRSQPFARPEVRQQILDLKAFFGISRCALDPWLDRTASPAGP